jgi:hypothetical protein
MIAEQSILQTPAPFAGMTDAVDLPDTEATGFRRLLRIVASHAQTIAIALLDGLVLASNPGLSPGMRRPWPLRSWQHSPQRRPQPTSTWSGRDPSNDAWVQD